MKAATTAMNNYINGELTTHCLLVKMVRQADGLTVGMTDHDYSVVYSGLTYQPESSYGKFNVNDKGNLDESTTQLDIPIDEVIFKRADFLARLWDHASITIYLINWADTSAGTIIIGAGSLGTFTVDEHIASVDYRGLAYSLKQIGGDLCQPDCRVVFGSPITQVGGGCGFDVTSKTQTGTVLTTDGVRIMTVSGISNMGDFYNDGLMVFTTGQNANLTFMYREVDFGGSVTVVLELPATFQIQIGDQFALQPACPKTIEGCIHYNNAINFQAEDKAPDPDAILQYPDADPGIHPLP